MKTKEVKTVPQVSDLTVDDLVNFRYVNKEMAIIP
jgi:hypothetical protein